MDELPSQTLGETSKKGSRKGKTGTTCCIPNCDSTQLHHNIKTGIGFFKLPSNKTRKKQWKKVISQYRRKSANGHFNIETARICEHHFKPDEINVSIGRGFKSVKKNAVPSVFAFKTAPTPPTRKPPKKRTDTRIVDKSIPAESVAEEREPTLSVNNQS